VIGVLFFKIAFQESIMRTLNTWAGRSTFSYEGSVSQGTEIIYGSGFLVKLSATQYTALLRNFHNRTVEIGTSRTDPPRGSLGEWLQAHVTKTAIASYVGPILIEEKCVVKIGSSQIKFI
jgi:hypothetical protein